MRISEISPDLRSAPPEAQSFLLDEIEASVKEVERLSPDDLLAGKLSINLQKTLSRLNSVPSLPESGKLHLWKLSYRLWNACVDLSNTIEIRSQKIPDLIHKIAEENAKLRQISAELLFLAGPVAGIPSPAFKSASFYYKTGLIWHDLRKFNLAANCFDRATDLVSKVPTERISDAEEQRFHLDLSLARSRTAWEVSERNVALALLNRSKNFLFGRLESYKTLAEQYLQFGKLVLSKDQRSRTNEALKLIEDAVDLCEKGSAVAKRPEETLDLKNLRSRALRFLAAAHLQMEEFESVLRCVRVLRDSRTSGEHPSVGFLAMKAWLGMGRCGEAEKELRGMVVNKEVPEGVCVSAVEAFFDVAGAAGAETVKGAFLGLLARCRLSTGAAVRVVHRLAAGGVGGEGACVMVKVVEELVSDERVVALFAGEGKAVAKDMHAVLWNSGGQYFRSKDYELSAEMFEKSMLYLPHDVENRTLRAQSYRVLCLCHLGLSHLDRAEEYINEAQKLEPSVACAFFKFKIYLQRNDTNAAIEQMQSMVSCFDFNPEYLTLSSHEAMACKAVPVAAACLTTLLSLYTPGKPMPMTEVAVLRNLIALLSNSTDNEHEILRFMSRTRTQMTELGIERFFGNGAVGSRELNWFAGNSWNMGIKTGKEKKYGLSAEFFSLASEFYGAMGDETDKGSLSMVCKSLILSVSAMMNSEKQKDTILADSDVKRGIELLDRAGKLLTSMPAAKHPANELSAIEPRFFFLHTFNSYLLCRRLDNTQSQQLQLIKTFAYSEHCTPQHLLQIGLAASQGPHPNLEAADFALNTSLTTLLASPVPDYQAVALVIRKLIMQAGFRSGDVENEAYAMYKQACRIMVGLKEGEYPIEEGKWLATTAWNRSVLPGRLGQMDLALRWMKMGLELARHVLDADGYKECMEECIAKIEKLGGGGGGTAADGGG